MTRIRVGIVGYGNLGKGLVENLRYAEDMELLGIFTRRNPNLFQEDLPFASYDRILDFKDKLDILFLCGGSQKDIPLQGPELLKNFNTIDAYDNHEEILAYLNKMDRIGKENKKVAIVGGGWDPGLFSLNRLIFSSILPQGHIHTFWGSGVSQGHSDALRRLEGVCQAVQYTVPNKEIMDKIRLGEDQEDLGKSAHKRVCYIVANEDCKKKELREEICRMPGYFQGYDVEVNFISQEEFEKNHQAVNHGGFVLASNRMKGSHQLMEFSLKMDSNPLFTSAVLVAMARAIGKFIEKEEYGAYSIFDIPPIYYSQAGRMEKIQEFL